jgi:elongation factor P--(R)-beta-lysine ligase
MSDFRPTASWKHLQLRAQLLRRLREFFDSRGFLEVQTPVLSADSVVDRNIDPFWIELVGDGQAARMAEHKTHVFTANSHISQAASFASRRWLQTSPEFAMKRLLAAGAGPIYEVARVFRQDEIGPLHNPEFTLIEWYRPGDTLEQGMQLTSDLCETLLQRGPCERISYAEAFAKYVGIDPHCAEGPKLAEITKQLGIDAPESMPLGDRDNWLDLLLVERIQPHLGVERPVLLYDYPASQAALARVRKESPEKPAVAERFELYIHGIELANGYHELLDADELRRRNATINQQRCADGKSLLPEKSRLLDAMDAGLPASVGVAMGFDRVAMLAAGAKSIAEVLAFPFDRA